MSRFCMIWIYANIYSCLYKEELGTSVLYRVLTSTIHLCTGYWQTMCPTVHHCKKYWQTLYPTIRHCTPLFATVQGNNNHCTPLNTTVPGTDKHCTVLLRLFLKKKCIKNVLQIYVFKNIYFRRKSVLICLDILLLLTRKWMSLYIFKLIQMMSMVYFRRGSGLGLVSGLRHITGMYII